MLMSRASNHTPVELSERSTEDLPEGWASTTLGEVVFPSKERIEPSECPNARYLSLEHIEHDAGRITGHGTGADVGSTKAVFQAGDVLYGKLRPYLNKVCIPSFAGICSTDILVFPKSACIEPHYLLRFLMQRSVVEYAHHHSAGVQLPRVSFDRLAKLEFPLPPLAEQKRIVAKVEELLGRVSAARQRLAKAPALLKRFRQSVLAAACSGQLTADWREAHQVETVEVALAASAKGVDTKAIRHLIRRGTEGLPEAEVPELPDTWASRSVRQLIELGAILDFQDGNHGSLYPRAADFGDSGVKFLTAAQVFDNRVWLDNAPLLKHEKAKLLRIGFARARDVLLTHNATVGRVALLPEYKGEVILGTSVTYYRTNATVLLPEYLCFAMQGQFWQDQLRSVMEQTTRNQVSVTKQVEFVLLIPPLKEQAEIVRRVEALLALADKIESRVQVATARVEKITQAILAKAFRAELVSTEAELARQEGRQYEPASVLLARIKSTAVVAPARKSKVAPRK
jgi:type I restriction enzyme S subunit